MLTKSEILAQSEILSTPEILAQSEILAKTRTETLVKSEILATFEVEQPHQKRGLKARGMLRISRTVRQSHNLPTAQKRVARVIFHPTSADTNSPWQMAARSKIT